MKPSLPTPSAPPLDWRFAFVWQGIRFHCHIWPQAEEVFNMEIIGDLCPLPFTAENPRMRARLFAIATAIGAEDATGFQITRQQRFQFFSRRAFHCANLTPNLALGEVAREVLCAKPWFHWFLSAMTMSDEEWNAAGEEESS